MTHSGTFLETFPDCCYKHLLGHPNAIADAIFHCQFTHFFLSISTGQPIPYDVPNILTLWCLMYDSSCKLQVWHPPVPSHLSQKRSHSTSCYPADSNVLCSCSQLVSAPPPHNYQGLSVGHHLLASEAWLQKHGNAMKTSHSFPLGQAPSSLWKQNAKQ